MIGGKKLYKLLKEDLGKIGEDIGRDKFFDILRKHELLVKRRKKHVKTTDSYHRFHKYKNKLKEKLLTGPNQAYVNDITYLRTEEGFMYLFLQTDGYSRMITGWDLSDSLAIEGAVKALQMTLRQCSNGEGVSRSNRLHIVGRGGSDAGRQGSGCRELDSIADGQAMRSPGEDTGGCDGDRDDGRASYRRIVEHDLGVEVLR